MIWTLFFLRRKTPSSELSNNLRNGQNAVFFSDHFHNDGVAEKIRHKLARANVRFPAVANSASSCTVNTCLEKIVLCSLQIYVRPVEKTHVSESNKIYFVSPTLPSVYVVHGAGYFTIRCWFIFKQRKNHGLPCGTV